MAGSGPDSASLYATDGPDQGVTFPVDKPVVTVGRSRTCDVVLVDPSVSRQHFHIEPRGRNLVLKNLSTKGTRVNGALVEETLLGDGDVITIGLTGLRVGIGNFVAPKVAPTAAFPGPDETAAANLASLSSAIRAAAEAQDGPGVMQALLGAAMGTGKARVGAALQSTPDSGEGLLVAGPGETAVKVKAQLQTGSVTWRRRLVDQALSTGSEVFWRKGGVLPHGIHGEDLEALEIRALILVPMGKGPSGTALLYLESDEAASFETPDLEFARALAVTALAFLPRAAKSAFPSPEPASPALSSLSRSILLPRAKGWFVATRVIPAIPPRGDFFDFQEAGDGSLVMIVASVSGTGMDRSLASVAARSTLKAVSSGSAGPAETLRSANRLFKQDFPPGMFVSAAVFWMESDPGTFRGATAGFGPCHIWRETSRRLELFHPKGIGMNIGPASLFESTLEETSAALENGDVLLALSKGLAESSNVRGETLGDEKLGTWLERGASSPEDFVAKLEREWRFFSGTAQGGEDITLIAATPDRRKGSRGDTPGALGYTSLHHPEPEER